MRADEPLQTEGVRTASGLVRRVMRAAPGPTFGAALCFVTHLVAEFTVPVLVGLAIDDAVRLGDPARLAWWCAALVADFLILAFAYRAGTRLGLRAFEIAQHRTRLAVNARVLSPDGFASARPPGELISIAGSDVSRLSHAVLIALHPVAELAALGYATVALGVISPALGAAVLGGALLLVVILEVLGRPLKSTAEREQERAAEVTAVAADFFAGAGALRSLGGIPRALERHRAANAVAVAAGIRARRTEAGFVAVSRILGAVLLVGIASAAAFLALDGELTVGQLVIVVGLLQLVLGPLEALAVNLGTVWLTAVASARRVLALLTEGPAAGSCAARPPAPGDTVPPARKAPTPADGLLGFSELAGTHLPPISLRLRTGDAIGIVADAHAVSELCEILEQRREPTAGQVTLAGTPLHAHDHRSRAGALLVAPRGVEGAHTQPPSGAAADAARLVLPAVSGGERQRLALATALDARTAVLVLREPTSALDPATEQLVARTLRAATAGRGLLVLTSSPAILSQLDAVHFLRNGTARRATHQELLADPEYRRMIS